MSEADLVAEVERLRVLTDDLGRRLILRVLKAGPRLCPDCWAPTRLGCEICVWVDRAALHIEADCERHDRNYPRIIPNPKTDL